MRLSCPGPPAAAGLGAFQKDSCSPHWPTGCLRPGWATLAMAGPLPSLQVAAHTDFSSAIAQHQASVTEPRSPGAPEPAGSPLRLVTLCSLGPWAVSGPASRTTTNGGWRRTKRRVRTRRAREDVPSDVPDGAVAPHTRPVSSPMLPLSTGRLCCGCPSFWRPLAVCLSVRFSECRETAELSRQASDSVRLFAPVLPPPCH